MRYAHWMPVGGMLVVAAVVLSPQVGGTQGRGQRGGQFGGGPDGAVSRIMALDKNGDGRLTKAEVTDPRLEPLFGIGVQFAWEASLLISGIRPPMWQPIVVNSLIETNLGLPYIYYIHKHVSARDR